MASGGAGSVEAFAWNAEERIGWRIDRGKQGERILSEVVWQNPHPDKTITSIDFVSGLKACAPFLVGITLE